MPDNPPASELKNVRPRPDEITIMLKAWSSGQREIADKFIPIVYEELRRQARRFLRRERGNHTLETAALVHEVYIRLVDQKDINWQSRAHFFGVAAEMMRRILVNYAVNRNRQKRGGGVPKITLDEKIQVGQLDRDVDLIALDEALGRLEKLDARQARIVELRYFGGLSIEETSEVLGISPATVKRDWNMARTWLRSELIPRDEP
jgi:RNA polymerase sigma factor (TIGR02999 family)